MGEIHTFLISFLLSVHWGMGCISRIGWHYARPQGDNNMHYYGGPCELATAL